MPADQINLPVISDEIEDSYAGASERLITIHFGIPDPPVINNPVYQDILIRWDRPLNWEDMRGGGIGSRSAYWHPMRTMRTTSYGRDGRDFSRNEFGESEMSEGDW